MRAYRIQLACVNWCWFCSRAIAKGEMAWRFMGYYACPGCYPKGEQS